MNVFNSLWFLTLTIFVMNYFSIAARRQPLNGYYLGAPFFKFALPFDHVFRLT